MNIRSIVVRRQVITWPAQEIYLPYYRLTNRTLERIRGENMNHNCIKKTITLGTMVALSSTSAVHAGPYGYDLHNTLAPASGAMAGTSIARPQDNVSATFGNPATLSKFKGTEFTFGATFYKPEVTVKHDGSVTGAAFKQKSGTDIFPVPEIAVTQDLRGLDIPGTLGLGLTATSGIGSEFRKSPESLGAGAEFIIFGVNAGAGFEVTENLNLGLSATISFAQLDFGLASTSAQTHDLGLRGTMGLTYDIGATTIGAFYQTKQKHEFDSIIATAPNNFSKVKIEQPENFGFGIANNSLMNGDLLLMADFMYKRWDTAEFWEDVYENQRIYTLGAQLTTGNWDWRLGYGHSNDPTRGNATGPIGSLSTVEAGGINGGAPLPLTGAAGTPIVQYLQATQTEVIYKNRVTTGFGYNNFLGVPFLSLDTQFGWQFQEKRDYGTGSLSGGGHTKAKVSSWHTGFALTWKFL
jgi:long-chain fatty acid transport protein